jgi:hypothetical protein
MSRFADDTDPAHHHDHDLDVLLAKVPAPPAREGLPPGFRMRAEPHYVETLDAPPGPSLQSLDVNAIETTASEPVAPAVALVESVRTHGLLQPLLVQPTGRGRYRLIAGHHRLAAAQAVGLRQVPCIVHTVTDGKAAELAREAHVTSTHRAAATGAPIDPRRHAHGTSCATFALDAALRGVASAATLMASTSPLVRTGGAQLAAAEAQRALRLLHVRRALDGDIVIRRAPVAMRALLESVRTSLEREYRTSGLERTIDVDVEADLTVSASDDWLRTAVCSAVAALSAADEAADRRRFTIAARGAGLDTVAVEIRDDGLSIPQRWVEHAFDDPWPIAEGATVLELLRAAREIADGHGGTVTIQSSWESTVVRLTLPSSRPSRTRPA